VTGEGVRVVTGDVTRSIEFIEKNKLDNRDFQPLVWVSYCVAFFHGFSINNFRSLFNLFKIHPPKCQNLLPLPIDDLALGSN